MEQLLSSRKNDGVSYITEVMKNVCNDIAQKKEQLLKDAMEAQGMPWTEEFIKEHISLVSSRPGDPFDHFWFNFDKPDAVRLVSIERDSEMAPLSEHMGSVTIKAEYRYY